MPTCAARVWAAGSSRPPSSGAREHGAWRIELWSDTRFEDAHRLYERLGYVKSGNRKLDDVNDTVEFRYERDLSDSDRERSPRH